MFVNMNPNLPRERFICLPARWLTQGKSDRVLLVSDCYSPKDYSSSVSGHILFSRHLKLARVQRETCFVGATGYPCVYRCINSYHLRRFCIALAVVKDSTWLPTTLYSERKMFQLSCKWWPYHFIILKILLRMPNHNSSVLWSHRMWRMISNNLELQLRVNSSNPRQSYSTACAPRQKLAILRLMVWWLSFRVGSFFVDVFDMIGQSDTTNASLFWSPSTLTFCAVASVIALPGNIASFLFNGVGWFAVMQKTSLCLSMVRTT